MFASVSNYVQYGLAQVRVGRMRGGSALHALIGWEVHATGKVEWRQRLAAQYGRPSWHARHLLSVSCQVLSDHEWAAGFLQRNQRALEGSYDLLTGAVGAWTACFLQPQALAQSWALRCLCADLMLRPCCRRVPLIGALTAEGIPFLPAVAGMFVWVDLR